MNSEAGSLPTTDAARHGTGNADLTVMVAAHDAFRRDLGKLATAASQARTWSPDRQAAVRAGWEIFQRQLHVHHRGEDAVVWPLGRQPGVKASFVPEFFGWLLDGAAPDRRASVLATLPAVMRPLVTGVFRPLYARRDAW
jgi:hypothetical protein